MGQRLRGRIAIVTGGASGIGRAIACLFAKEGAQVVILDVNEAGSRDTVQLITDAGGGAMHLRSDVSREDEVRTAVEAAVKAYGGVNILVNDAAVESARTITETSFEEWERVHAINLRGVFLCCKHAIEYMRSHGGGAIVNISSVAALVAIPEHAAYASSKAGVVGLTRQIALDYGPSRIRANCVCPTTTDTPMVRAAGGDDAILEARAQRHPLRRIAQADDIAYAALFLASEEARCITGVALPVDAGWTVR